MEIISIAHLGIRLKHTLFLHPNVMLKSVLRSMNKAQCHFIISALQISAGTKNASDLHLAMPLSVELMNYSSRLAK